jgi:chemotaxis protein MotB
MLRPIDNKVRLVGHTNNTPSSNPLYPTNWELSLGRALSVGRYLMNGGISPDRFSIAGRGEYEPLFPNDTAQHQGLNARVEIVILYPVESNIIETNTSPQPAAP